MLLNDKTEHTTDTCNKSQGESQKYYSKQKMPDARQAQSTVTESRTVAAWAGE